MITPTIYGILEVDFKRFENEYLQDKLSNASHDDKFNYFFDKPIDEHFKEVFYWIQENRKEKYEDLAKTALDRWCYQSFIVGDVVTLKSGGPNMTVVTPNSRHERIECGWYAGAEYKTADFDANALMKVDV